MTEELIKYEKIITINHDSIDIVINCMNMLLRFIEEKCKKDNERLEYFQCNLTDSEKNQFAKDLKIKWAVQKND